MILLTMLLIPTMVAFGFMLFGGSKVTLKEFLVQMGTQLLLISIVALGISCQNTSDVEILNGRVTGKTRERVHCRHSYPCRCRQICGGSGKDISCYTHCGTCYSHSYDIDWNVQTSFNREISIDTVDRQGLIEPPRWTKVIIGEPVSMRHSYKNYIKASPDTLFRHQGLTEKYAKKLPTYPSNVYDYYRLDRLVQLDIKLPDVKEWNSGLSELNAELGAAKQVNIVLVVTKDMPQDYFYALEQHWIGGKKNDVILVVSVDEALKLQWVNVMAWTDNKMFQVALRDQVMSIGNLDRPKILEATKNAVASFYVRKPMKDFEYLKDLVRPTPRQWLFAMLFGLVISVCLGVFFHRNDVFDEERGYRRRW